MSWAAVQLPVHHGPVRALGPNASRDLLSAIPLRHDSYAPAVICGWKLDGTIALGWRGADLYRVSARRRVESANRSAASAQDMRPLKIERVPALPCLLWFQKYRDDAKAISTTS